MARTHTHIHHTHQPAYLQNVPVIQSPVCCQHEELVVGLLLTVQRASQSNEAHLYPHAPPGGRGGVERVARYIYMYPGTLYTRTLGSLI